ncbi:MAG: tetratricopeptide repeat protein [Acidobacteriota bacterium]
MFYRYFALALGLAFALVLPGLAAQRPERKPSQKPVLIRDDEPRPITEESIILDPYMSKRNVEIGDYYFKKDSYAAAAVRYRQAIRHKPEWFEGYEKLAKTQAKMKDWAGAIQTYRQFIALNPDSSRKGDIEDRIKDLERKR